MCACSTCTAAARSSLLFFFFNDPATTEIYTLSLHDALPISERYLPIPSWVIPRETFTPVRGDRKSTRLNSSHRTISYAVFCLKKKKKRQSSHTSKTARYRSSASTVTLPSATSSRCPRAIVYP